MRQVAAAQFQGPGRIDIRRTTAEADTVVVEADVFFTLRDGREYRNAYCCVVSFSGGKIRLVECYYDTAHAHRTFGVQA
jgi:ketosteroid isomerase-like protein